MSRNTAVYRYRGIFEPVYYCRAFSNTAHPYIKLQQLLAVDGLRQHLDTSSVMLPNHHNFNHISGHGAE